MEEPRHLEEAQHFFSQLIIIAMISTPFIVVRLTIRNSTICSSTHIVLVFCLNEEIIFRWNPKKTKT